MSINTTITMDLTILVVVFIVYLTEKLVLIILKRNEETDEEELVEPEPEEIESEEIESEDEESEDEESEDEESEDEESDEDDNIKKIIIAHIKDGKCREDTYTFTTDQIEYFPRSLKNRLGLGPFRSNIIRYKKGVPIFLIQDLSVREFHSLLKLISLISHKIDGDWDLRSPVIIDNLKCLWSHQNEIPWFVVMRDYPDIAHHLGLYFNHEEDDDEVIYEWFNERTTLDLISEPDNIRFGATKYRFKGLGLTTLLEFKKQSDKSIIYFPSSPNSYCINKDYTTLTIEELKMEIYHILMKLKERNKLFTFLVNNRNTNEWTSYPTYYFNFGNDN